MYLIIVGAGKVGYYLAQLLLEENHDVIVIDKDTKMCEEIASELDLVATNGDATEPEVLEKAGVKDCDALIALTSIDETNMVISLLAKDLGARTVVTKIRKVQYDEKVLKKLGIDIVIHPEAAAAGYIAELITKPEVLDLAFISRGEAEIMEIMVKEGSKIAGKKVGEIEQPEGSSIVAITTNNKLEIPNKDTMINVGQKVLILAKTEIANKVRKSIS